MEEETVLQWDEKINSSLFALPAYRKQNIFPTDNIFFSSMRGVFSYIYLPI